MKLVREPGAGNLHAGFDERGAETERMARLSGTPARKGGNSLGSHGLDRHRVAPRLYGWTGVRNGAPHARREIRR